MHVDAERALRGVVPAGWQIVMEPDTVLNGRVSWSPADTWIDVLDRIAERSRADLRVNWGTQQVFVSAMKAAPAKPAEVVNNGVSPVEEPHNTKAFEPATDPADAASATTTAVAAQTTTASPAPTEKATQAPAVSPAGPARAFNRTPLRAPLEALAQRHGLTLIYNMGDVSLPGPVTLMLGDELSADIELLNRALGPGTQLEIIEYRAEKELVVSPGCSNSFVSLPGRSALEKRSLFARLFGKKVTADSVEKSATTEKANAPEKVTPVEKVAATEKVVATEPPPSDSAGTARIEPPAVSSVAATTEPAREAQPVESGAPTTAEVLALDLAQGERLSSAMDRLLQSRGWRLVWRASVDLEAATPARVEGASLSEILEQVLPQLGLAADLYNPSRTAVIRNSQETASQGAP